MVEASNRLIIGCISATLAACTAQTPQRSPILEKAWELETAYHGVDRRTWERDVEAVVSTIDAKTCVTMRLKPGAAVLGVGSVYCFEPESQRLISVWHGADEDR
jgi:hypothetical protein